MGGRLLGLFLQGVREEGVTLEEVFSSSLDLTLYTSLEFELIVSSEEQPRSPRDFPLVWVFKNS